MTKKTEAQHTLNIVIKEIPNTSDVKLIIQQIDESTKKEVNRKEIILRNKTVEEAEALIMSTMSKHMDEGSLKQTLRKPFTH